MLRHVVAFVSLFALCLQLTAGVPFNETCSSTSLCDANLVCDTKLTSPQCKWDINQTCSDQTHQDCATGLSCINTYCKIASCTHNPCHGGACNGASSDIYSCTCPENFIGTFCETARLPPGHQCDTQPNSCVVGATCQDRTPNKICLCTNGYFATTEGTCETRKPVGRSCLLNITTQNMCVDGAACDTHSLTCKCVPSHYADGSGSCSERITVGTHCTVNGSCIENAVCNDNPDPNQKTCQCEHDFYANKATICLRKKSPGMSCNVNNPEECVEHSECRPGICNCLPTYYAYNMTCRLRQHLDGSCHDTIPDMCLLNGVCIGRRCQCNNSTYRSNVNEYDTFNDTCVASLTVDAACSLASRDVKQCESNSKCVFRSWDNVPVCGCDVEHFFNGHVCVPRGNAGDPCPLDSTDVPRAESSRQCVENALCSDSSTCECTDGYFQREGHCPPRVAVGGVCDPWRDDDLQCDNNLRCVYGVCTQ